MPPPHLFTPQGPPDAAWNHHPTRKAAEQAARDDTDPFLIDHLVRKLGRFPHHFLSPHPCGGLGEWAPQGSPDTYAQVYDGALLRLDELGWPVGAAGKVSGLAYVNPCAADCAAAFATLDAALAYGLDPTPRRQAVDVFLRGYATTGFRDHDGRLFTYTPTRDQVTTDEDRTRRHRSQGSNGSQ